jgi:hypothetical protein
MQLKMENQSNKGKGRNFQPISLLPVPRKRSRSQKDPLDNWQTLCKREAREVGLFRASP